MNADEWKKLKPERIIVSERDYETIVRAIENPPQPNKKLRELMQRTPRWEKKAD